MSARARTARAAADIPPADLQAERAILGNVLLGQGTDARVVGQLRIGDFFTDENRAIYRAILSLAERKEPIDTLTVQAELHRSGELALAGGPSALARLLEEAAIAVNLDAYVLLVRDKARLRELMALGRRLEHSASNGSKPDELLAEVTRAVAALTERGAEAGAADQLGIGLGHFLAQTFPPTESYIDSVLSSEGSGWLVGEEKLGKTFYALNEALCLALGLTVCGRFTVPAQRRVLFLEEEDGPRRTHRRVSPLLRGYGLEPEDPALHATLNAWFRIAVWSGFSFDNPQRVAQLEAAIAEFRPAVVYIDVLRKVTLRDLNKAVEASGLLAILDDLRRRYGTLFRILAHYRKVQGFRAGRGSQEIGGSYVLGAWAESSLFFEPVGRKHGAVRVEVQSKDGPPVAAFRLVIEAEGPPEAPTVVRLKAEEDAGGEDLDELVYQTIATLPPIESLAGKPGVTLEAIAAAVKRAPRTVRRSVRRLEEARRIAAVGQLARQKLLYGVIKP